MLLDKALKTGQMLTVVRGMVGEIWDEATSSAAFPPRYWHTSVVYEDKMWVIKGSDDSAEK